MINDKDADGNTLPDTEGCAFKTTKATCAPLTETY